MCWNSQWDKRMHYFGEVQAFFRTPKEMLHIHSRNLQVQSSWHTRVHFNLIEMLHKRPGCFELRLSVWILNWEVSNPTLEYSWILKTLEKQRKFITTRPVDSTKIRDALSIMHCTKDWEVNVQRDSYQTILGASDSVSMKWITRRRVMQKPIWRQFCS